MKPKRDIKDKALTESSPLIGDRGLVPEIHGMVTFKDNLDMMDQDLEKKEIRRIVIDRVLRSDLHHLRTFQGV